MSFDPNGGQAKQPFRLDEEAPEKENAQDNQHRDNDNLYQTHSDFLIWKLTPGWGDLPNILGAAQYTVNKGAFELRGLTTMQLVWFHRNSRNQPVMLSETPG